MSDFKIYKYEIRDLEPTADYVLTRATDEINDLFYDDADRVVIYFGGSTRTFEKFDWLKTEFDEERYLIAEFIADCLYNRNAEALKILGG